MSTTDQFDAASAEAAASSQTTALGAIAAYSPTEAALALLAEKYKDATYDLTTVKGDKAARAARKELTGLRTSLEAKRKQLKAPALEYSRRIDSEAARITNAIAALEDPISDQIKADEQRREDERQERARAEATRIEAHQKAVEVLRRVPPQAYHADTTPEQIDTMMAALLLIPIGPDLEEFEQQAEAAVSATLATLRELRAAALGRQLEIRRVQTERAELDRRRAEDAAREQAKREQDAHYLAAEQARVRAEATEINGLCGKDRILARISARFSSVNLFNLSHF